MSYIDTQTDIYLKHISETLCRSVLHITRIAYVYFTHLLYLLEGKFHKAKQRGLI